MGDTNKIIVRCYDVLISVSARNSVRCSRLEKTAGAKSASAKTASAKTAPPLFSVRPRVRIILRQTLPEFSARPLGEHKRCHSC